MKPESAIATVERLFRYLVPGFLFHFLAQAAFPSLRISLLQSLSGIEFAIYLPCVGMMIYGIHRVFYWVVVDYVFSKLCVFPKAKLGQSYVKTIAYFVHGRGLCAGKPCLDYLHYRWAIVHYCLILAELICLFSIFNQNQSFFNQHHVILLASGAGLWLFVMVHYVQMLFAEKWACDKCKDFQSGD